MIKKIASIFFLSVFLFNWFGYRLLSIVLEDRANSALVAELDKDQYDDSALITIKLPSNLPYYTNSKHYERMDGELEINGMHYNYVKCRIYKDTVEYLCIPNQIRTRLSNARDEFYKLVNDLQHPTQNKKTGDTCNSIKSLLSEYYQETNSWAFDAFLPEQSVNNSYNCLNLSKPAVLPQELPPDAC
ncbi:MAG: hypothetical protein ABIN89_03510 [Chitinophagaceae bacterium]